MSSTLANRYLGPEDLSSLPTTLDAKQSPLALLARTCSSIGADVLPPNQKPIIPPLEKPSKHRNSDSNRSDSVSSDKNGNLTDSLRSNSAGSVETRISFKPYETKCSSSSSSSSNSGKSDSTHHNNNDSSRSNSVHVIDAGRIKDRTSSGGSDRDHRSPKVPATNHNDSRTSPSSSSSSRLNSVPNDRDKDHHHTHHSSSFHHRNNSDDHHSNAGDRVNSNSNSNKHHHSLQSRDSNHSPSSSKVSLLSPGSTAISYTSSGSTELSKSQLTPLSKSDSLSTSCKTSSASGVSNLGVSVSGAGGCMNGLNGYQRLSSSIPHQIGADLLSASSHYPPGLLSPYLNHHQAAAFSNFKAAQAVAASICRDGPYCKHCQLTAAAALSGMSCNNGACPVPCNGAHPMQQTASSNAAAAAAAAAANISNFLPHFAYSSYAAMAASNPSGAAPRVCGWASCGKTFTNNDELNQHVKTHLTSNAAAAAAAVANSGSPLSGLGDFYNTPQHSLASAYSSALSARAGGPGGPSLSQLDAFRFHPYKVPGSGLSPSLTSGLSTTSPTSHIPGLTGAGLPPYYQTYGLYNGRI